MEKFTFFYGGIFSQWYPCKFYAIIAKETIEFNCAEQYMMYCKAMSFKDYDIAAQILATNSPREQKKLGRKVANFNKEKWDSVSYNIVLAGNYHKFSQNPALRKELLATGDTVLVEASPVDRMWGIGLSYDDPRALNRSTWLGENRLGEVLTSVKEKFVIEDTHRTTVVHCMKEEYDVYIGRANSFLGESGLWGNPFEIGKDGTRDQVISKHREWIKTQPHLLAQIRTLQGKRLGCYCSPQLCHGHTLAAMADGLEV